MRDRRSATGLSWDYKIMSMSVVSAAMTGAIGSSRAMPHRLFHGLHTELYQGAVHLSLDDFVGIPISSFSLTSFPLAKHLT